MEDYSNTQGCIDFTDKIIAIIGKQKQLEQNAQDAGIVRAS